MGVVVMPPLPPVSPEDVQNSRVPSLHGHYPASPLLRTRPPPSRRRPISRVPRLYDRPASADFAVGRGGLLQLLNAAASPCCRSKPRGRGPPRQPDCDGPWCLRGVIDRSASGVWIFRGHLTFTCVTARWLAAPPLMALSIGFRGSVSLPPALQATGRLALAPAGLTPASRTCLSLDTRSPGPPAPAPTAESSARVPWRSRSGERRVG